MSTTAEDMRPQEGGIVREEMVEEEIEGLQLMMVRRRHLGYETFDADNHLYEGSEDAVTKFLPPDYRDLMRFAAVKTGDKVRNQLLVNGRLAGFFPNPTFSRVIPPGGRSHDPQQRRAIDGSAAFFDPGPRLRLMDEFGIDRCLLFPTLAGTMEPYFIDNVEAYPVFCHAFNEWLLEHWSYNYENRIFAGPLISLGILEEAIKELEFVLERGARAVWVGPTPHMGLHGPRSFAVPEFDPFWKLVEAADVLVAMHSSLWRLDRPTDPWEGGDPSKSMVTHGENGTPAFMKIANADPILTNALASLIGHGLGTRFPKLKLAPIEFRVDSIPEFVDRIQRAYEETPFLFDEDPYDVLRRNVYLHCFQDKDPLHTIELMGIDHVMWGSDFPHPEGLNDPLAYVELLEDLPVEDRAKVMGGTLARLVKVDAAA
jgi:predicted TIM-barrel fold metal-dependent hydrolase